MSEGDFLTCECVGELCNKRFIKDMIGFKPGLMSEEVPDMPPFTQHKTGAANINNEFKCVKYQGTDKNFWLNEGRIEDCNSIDSECNIDNIPDQTSPGLSDKYYLCYCSNTAVIDDR